MSEKPISDLRRRVLEDMAVRQFGDKTRHDYIRHIESFARFLGRSPDTATAEDVRRFQVSCPCPASTSSSRCRRRSALSMVWAEALNRRS